MRPARPVAAVALLLPALAAAGEPPVAEPPVAEPPVAEPPVAEPPVAEPPVAEPPVALGTRLEPMADGFLVEGLSGGARLELHHPEMREVAVEHDAPWEGSGSGYHTVFADRDEHGPLYRLYYRGAQFDFVPGKLTEGHPAVVCYAESRDGIRWEKPDLGLIEFDGSAHNNIVWAAGRAGHNFAPFRDARPDVPADERYKALAYPPRGRSLQAFASPDGLRWRVLFEEPVLTGGRFDSLNVAFWDAPRGEYRVYCRGYRDGLRDVRTATSPDFRRWSDWEWLDHGDAPAEQLYTNAVQPYARAPHLLIGLPMRYVERDWSPSMRALPEPEHRELRASAERRFGTTLTDALLMTSRDRVRFRRWGEAFLRPGPQRPGTWNYGHLGAAAGLIVTPPPVAGAADELSLYVLEGGWTGTSDRLRRYALRIDGFASVHAGAAERGEPAGEMRTKPLTFEGAELALNFATSAAGSVTAAIHDERGRPIPGFGLDDCDPLFGDDLARPVTWRGRSDVSALAGRPVRLRFVLNDADLYALQFRDAATP